MTVIYRCDFCKKEFKNLEECRQYEQLGVWERDWI